MAWKRASPPPRDLPDAVPGERLVCLRDDPVVDGGTFLRDFDELEPVPVARGLLPRVYLLRDDPRQARFLQDHGSRILYQHPNYYLDLQAGPQPAAPDYDEQWALHPVTSALKGEHGQAFVPAPDAHVDAPRAWSRHTGRGFEIAVLDTGLDPQDPQLEPNIGPSSSSAGRDFVTGKTVKFDSTSFGHGTRVASIIGAVTSLAPPSASTSAGIAGINWACSILPLRVFGNTPSPQGRPANRTTVRRVADALAWVKRQKIRVSNNSYGAKSIPDAKVLKNAIRALGKKEHLCVCAAGNEEMDLDQVDFFPASFGLDNMVVVTSTGPDDRIPKSRGRGKKSVHLAAPGEDIYALQKYSLYGMGSGTSYATAHVTGAVALVWDYLDARGVKRDAQEIKALLEGSVRRPQHLAGEVAWNGALDLGRLLENASHEK